VWWLLPAFWLVTLAIYSPAWHGGVLWDDDAHLTRAALQSVTGLGRIWTDVTVTQQYYPVVHSTFWVMNRLWGHDTFGYHLLNILLHGTSAFLVGLILRRLAVPGAWLAALLFAVHPVHVESVAWMTELKNTLSGVCYLAAALAYLRFDTDRSRRAYGLALVLFVLALLSKTVTGTLPAALLVVFWWQRGRLDWRRDVGPLVPFFVLGLASGILTAWVERTYIGAEGAEFQFTIVERGLIAGRVIWFYLAKLLWPANLIFMYPRWEISQQIWWQYLFPLAALALLAAAWWWRARSRAPLAALLLFGGTLFPALGFVNVYPFRYSFVADHFQYLASLAILAPIAAGLATLVARRRVRPTIATALVIAGIMPIAGLAWQQTHQYVDAETLYRTTIARNPECWMAYTNLALREMDGSPERVTDAIAHLREALRINPNNAEAHNTLGLIWQRMGRADEAMAEHREAARLAPGLAEAHYNVGYDLQARGQFAEAIAPYETSLRLDPTNPKARHNLANVLLALGRVDDAARYLEEAVRFAPDSAEIRQNLGTALLRLGRSGDAIAQFREALRLSPNLAESHNNLALALQQAGQPDEALAELRESARLMPGSVRIHRNLGEALLALGRPAEALTEFQNGLALGPDPMRADLFNNLGVAEMRLGRRDLAVPHFTEALRLRPDFPTARANLATAIK
jgi:tetratricopeptide (TPR) repeat protein